VLVLELVTEQVAALITDRLRIPTIGIGSGRYCDGQVLVVTDVLGISAFERKIFRRYMDFRPQALDALSRYRQDVEGQRFPTEANAFPTDPQELAQLREWLDSHEQSVPVQETHSS
jgi:3-methyl-2-oxobutanoate hydroxymethyltransferase